MLGLKVKKGPPSGNECFGKLEKYGSREIIFFMMESLSRKVLFFYRGIFGFEKSNLTKLLYPLLAMLSRAMSSNG